MVLRHRHLPHKIGGAGHFADEWAAGQELHAMQPTERQAYQSSNESKGLSNWLYLFSVLGLRVQVYHRAER